MCFLSQYNSTPLAVLPAVQIPQMEYLCIKADRQSTDRFEADAH